MKLIKDSAEERKNRALAPIEHGGLPAPQQSIDVTYYPVENHSEWTRMGEIGRIVSRRRAVVITAVLLGFAAGAGISALSVPRYRAAISLEVQGLNEDFLDLRKVDPSARPTAFSAESYIQTQADILQDDVLLNRVIGRLNLADNRWFQPKQTVVNSVASFLQIPVRQDPQRPIDILRQNLLVGPSPHSNVIRITFNSPDRQLSAEVVNTLADEFIKYNLENRLNASKEIVQWLSPQLTAMRQKLEFSEAQLTRASQAAGVLMTTGTETVAEEKLRQVQRELAAAQADRIAKESAYQVAMQNPVDVLPAGVELGNLKEQETKLTDLRRQRAELDALYTDKNYRVLQVQAQINELQAALDREKRAIPERAKNAYEAALRRETALAKAYDKEFDLVDRQARERVRYESLKQAVDDNRQIYQSTLQKVEEAGIASAIKPSSVRIIGPATPPQRPYSPNLPLNLSLSTAAGLCLGLIAAAARERSKPVLRAPSELGMYVDVPVLGAIPTANRRSLHPGSSTLVLDTAPVVRPELATWQEKHSIVSESFREVLVSLVFSQAKTLLVTSANSREGKTTVVSNLAIALAEIGKRVLLIDGDLRKPRLHTVFNQPNTWGLTTLLSEKDSIHGLPANTLSKRTEIPGLSLIPSGPVTEHVSTLLNSERMKELIERLTGEFDYILLDAPPALGFSDARILARWVDAVVLVVRANSTHPDTIREAAARFQMINVPIMGTILNDYDHDANRYGYGYNYGYYRRLPATKSDAA